MSVVSADGDVVTSPTKGKNGMSPDAPAQPVPDRCVRLNPRIFGLLKPYPPGATVRVWLPRVFSGRYR